MIYFFSCILLGVVIFLVIRLSKEKNSTKQSDSFIQTNKIDEDLKQETNHNTTGINRNEELFKKVESYLSINKDFISYEFDRKTLAKALGTNETYLYIAIKEATGKTIQEYINSLRIELGSKILCDDYSKSIDSIACECGFKTSRTFYRLFREHYNMSPTEYRASLKNNE